jgi:hypothetical protein
MVFAADSGNLRAGAFQQDITPENFTQLTNFGGRALEGVHDKIHARALVLDDGATNTIRVTLANGRVGSFVDDATYDIPNFLVQGNRLKRGCAEQSIVKGLVELMEKR